MFDIAEIHLENFRSYRGKHCFTFPSEPGLYFLTGTNQKDPRLESNGSGKSSLLDAIYWCLYGKTLRGLKATDVISWGEKSCHITLIISIGTSAYRIRRTQGPNSLKIDDELVEQPAVNKLLGLEPDGFQRSVIMAQFNEAFLDLGPTDKLGLFSQIMNLDYWLDHSAQADKKSKSILIKIEAHERALMAIDASIQATVSNIKNFLEQEGAYARSNKEEQKRLNAKLKEAEADFEAYLLAEELGDTKIALVEAELKKIKVLYDSTKAEDDELAEHGRTLEKREAEAVTLTKIAREALKPLEELDSICPTCLQQIDQSHLEAEIKKAHAKLAKAVTKYDEIALKITHNDEKREEIGQELYELKAKIHSANENLKKLSRDQTSATIAKSEAKGEVESIKKVVEKLRTSPNPYTQPRLKAEADLVAYHQNEELKARALKKLKDEYAAISYWIQGFKRVRLFIIEETLRSLEAEVNSCLVSLGLSGWSIEFDVERENKSGGITKGFVVLIKAPGYDHPIKWEAWSGGEAQRLTLAANLGLANLIMQQAGLQNKIEFYDEPSKHLSKAGLMDLAETLHQRAIDDQKVIFLVDHNMPEFGEFAGVIKVTKDVDGNSTISMEGN